MNPIVDLITNKTWDGVYKRFLNESSVDLKGYREAVGFSFKFSPVEDNMMSRCDAIFDIEKAANMFFWYRHADSKDTSIIEYFDEYAKCIDENHNTFNSNYGVHFYKNGGIQHIIKELTNNPFSRRACFCINNNAVIYDDNEIDKLCTNTIQFIIHEAKLEMIVQMRSSNFLTLLPYDAFMFSVFYLNVFSALKSHFGIIMPGMITMQIGSLHTYSERLNEIQRLNNTYYNVDNLLDFKHGLNTTVTILNKYIQK